MKEENDNEQSFSALLNAVIESTADGILVISTEGRVIKSNKKFQKLWNIPENILETKDDNTIISFITNQLNNHELFLTKVKFLYDNPTEEDKDILSFKDGRIFERYSTPFIVDNNIKGRVWSFRDITHQKQIQEKLQAKRLLLRTIIDSMPDAIYAKDLQFRKTLANKADLKNMGCKDESEVLGKTDFDFFSEKSAAAFNKDDKNVIETGSSIINREETFINSEGQKNWLLTTKIPLVDSDNKILGLIGVGRNITIGKRNELIREALYEISESVLAAQDMNMLYKRIHYTVAKLMNAENFFIALYDEINNVLSFPYMVDEFDLPYESEPFGNGLTEYVIRKGEPALIDAQRDFELRENGEVELIGTPAAIWLGVPLKDGDKILGVIVVQDYDNPKAYGTDEMQLLGFISEQIANAIVRKRNAEEIKKYIAELKELNNTKDKFFSIIAHDLKNPFITLMGFSEILLSDFEELESEEILYYIKEMKFSADLSYNLLQNLLQWSRSQTGKIEFHPESIEINNLVEQNILLVENSAAKKEINLINNVIQNVFINADEDMLNTIIRNLITNAVKFTNKNGKVTIDSVLEDNNLKISVSDNGVGMEERTVEKLFKLDSTESHLGTENETGTGLGLILCKEFVEKHGGQISVDSKLGTGTTFSFTIPL